MISKAKIKLIKSLELKKFRDTEKLFPVEGNKMVKEALLSGFEVAFLAGTENFLDSVEPHLSKVEEVFTASPSEIKAASFLRAPQDAIALCKIPEKKFPPALLSTSLTLCLDDIQDPGNMGTILRIADWFGITTICASPCCADIYNPKVVQATMGAIWRTDVFYLDLPAILNEAGKAGIPVFGAFLDGENIYNLRLPENGIIVMGNEGHGISGEVAQQISRRLKIPGSGGSESLNVSAATAIICSEFRREILKGS